MANSSHSALSAHLPCHRNEAIQVRPKSFKTLTVREAEAFLVTWVMLDLTCHRMSVSMKDADGYFASSAFESREGCLRIDNRFAFPSDIICPSHKIGCPSMRNT